MPKPGQHLNRRQALGALGAAALGLHLGRRPGARQGGELVITGGEVFTPDGLRETDLRIVGGRITEIAPRLRPPAGATVLDARGHLVLPGGIDPHTHLSPPFVDDLTSGSRDALAGGITTVGTFAYPRRGADAITGLRDMAVRVQREAIADVILHAYAWPPTPEAIARVPEIAAFGQPSLKIFMLLDTFEEHAAGVVRMIEAARDAGVVTMMHCEDATLLAAAADRLVREGHTSLRYFAESRPPITEVVATERAVGICEFTRAPMYVVHLSSARALDACRNEHTRGFPLFVETRPLYLHFTEGDLAGANGALFVGQPPLRQAEDAEALWRGLADGRIDVMGTDHAPWTREQKLDPALDVMNLRPGVANLGTMLPVYFSEGVRKNRVTLERFVETTATNAARIFGLYPHKGVITLGAWADLVLWDPDRSHTISAADVRSRAGYSPFEGWTVTGWPMVVLRRGDIVMRDGQILAGPGSGRLLTRSRHAIAG